MLAEYKDPTRGNDHIPSEDILSKLGPGSGEGVRPSEMQGGLQRTPVAGKGLE